MLIIWGSCQGFWFWLRCRYIPDICLVKLEFCLGIWSGLFEICRDLSAGQVKGWLSIVLVMLGVC